MRKILLIAMIATLLPLPSARAGGGVVERTVSFEVINHHRSATAPLCQGDGKTYTTRGSLVGPAGVQAGRIDSVTLYLHGSGDASTWHFGAVAGVDHIAEMARLGHASVFPLLDRRGLRSPLRRLQVVPVRRGRERCVAIGALPLA